MIVTLAGHVDHGKTTLVRRLTGTDTDRLAEEQRRGLTIDLGFAYLHRGDVTVGFVDVPGHHRFIHNMVAGIAAMQQALLVIAADDGPMPQTREHLQILQLLGLGNGVVALTKCDRVDAARIREVRTQVAALLAGSFLENGPVLEISAGDAPGIAALEALLLERARASRTAETERPFRLAVDRSFILKGAGPVATGTVHTGSVRLDDELYLFPHGRRVRVRELRVQDQPAACAQSGDRAAINLAGELDGLARGDWLVSVPERGSRTAVVELEILPDFPRTVRHWTPAHVYHATRHTTARLALLQGVRADPGERVLAELLTDEPLPVKHGDRLVLRDQALERTLGGGRVIDNRPANGRRRAAARLAGIAACRHDDPAAALAALLTLGPVDVAAFRGLWNTQPDVLDTLLGEASLVHVDGQAVAQSQWRAWAEAMATECRHRLAQDVTLPGLRENEFAAPVPTALRGRLLAELVAAGELEQRGGRYRPLGHQVRLDPFERNTLDRLKPLLDQPQPPSLGDLARLLKQPLTQLQKLVQALSGKGELVLVNDKRVYLPQHVTDLADVAERLSARGPFTARDFRDAAGIGRNVAIDVLEYFDSRGFTRRQGDTRSVVGARSRLGTALG